MIVPDKFSSVRIADKTYKPGANVPDALIPKETKVLWEKANKDFAEKERLEKPKTITGNPQGTRKIK